MAKYIDKTALEEEIKKLKAELPKNRGYKRNAYNHVLHILDTLEVKGVDLDTEIIKWEESFGHYPASMGYKETAKHFFELGLKAQKGERV